MYQTIKIFNEENTMSAFFNKRVTVTELPGLPQPGIKRFHNQNARMLATNHPLTPVTNGRALASANVARAGK